MSNCPSPDILERFLTGNLSQVEATEFRGHIAGCEFCLVRLDEMSDDQELAQYRADVKRVQPLVPADVAFRRLLERAGSTANMAEATETMRNGSYRGPLSFLGPPVAADELGTLANYRILDELDRGGMGIVLRARDEHLQRIVAIKVLNPDRADPEGRRRFVRESQAAALVKHPGIVDVFSVGNPPDGPPYLVMEYVQGSTLREEIRRRGRLDSGLAADIICQVAQGLAAAHAKGLVHRDVKPANVLLQRTDRAETSRDSLAAGLTDSTDQPSFRAKITDFGLALLDGSSGALTQTGVIAGTPHYMSPEQAGGEATCDERTDIYSLGVTLYEALVGEVPFRGAPRLVLRQIALEEPRRPRQLHDDITSDLETICLKAMAKEPARRYESAKALADDLQRWMRHEPILARPAGTSERLRLWTRRNPRVAGLVGTVVTLLLLLAGGATTAAFWIAAQQTETERQRAIAVRAASDSRQAAEVARKAEQEQARQAAAAEESARTARLAEEKAKALAAAAAAGRGVAMDALSSLVGQVMERLSDTAGTIKLREELMKTAIDGLNKVSDAAAQDASLDRNVMLTHQRLGLIHIDAGRTDQAVQQFQRSQDLAKSLLAVDPDNALIQRDLARAYGKLGDLAYHQHDDDTASRNYLDALAIYESQQQREPVQDAVLDGLTISHNNLARLLERQQKLAEARGHAEQSLQIAEKLAEAKQSLNTLNTSRFRRGLGVSLSRLGLICKSMGDISAARQYFQRQLTLFEQLVAEEPENSTYLGDLAISFQNLADLHTSEWQFEQAAEVIEQARQYYEARVAKDPENAVAKRNLAVTWTALGDVQSQFDTDAARNSFETSLRMLQESLRLDPTSMQKTVDVLECISKLAGLLTRGEHYADAQRVFDDGLNCIRRITNGPEQAGAKLLAAWSEDANGQIAALRAAADPATVETSLSTDVLRRWRRIQAVSLARHGRCQEARQVANVLLEEKSLAADDLISVVASYSLCLAASTSTKQQADLVVAETSLEAALRAVRVLYTSHPQLLSSEPLQTDLGALREHPPYRELLAELRKTAGTPVNK